MKYRIFIIIFFIPIVTIGANNDSLWNVWNDNTRNDTSRLMAIHKLAWKYLFTNPDSAFMLSKWELEIAEEQEKRNWAGAALNTMAISYAVRGNPYKALNYYNLSLEERKKTGMKSHIAGSYINIGNTYDDIGDWPKALNCFIQALEIYEQLNDSAGIATSYGNIGYIYLRLEDVKSSINYQLRSLEIKKNLRDSIGIARGYNNLGNVYKEINKLDKALEYQQKSLSIKRKIGDKRGEGLVMGSIAAIYKEQMQFQRALEIYVHVATLFEKLDFKPGLATVYFNIGTTYLELGKWQEAKNSCKEGLAVAENISALEAIKDNCSCLHIAFEKLGNSNDALFFYKKSIEAKDSLINENNTREVTQLEMQYEFDKQQVQQQAEQEKKDAIAEAELKREKTVRYGFMGGFGLLMVLVVLIYRNLRQKKRANKLIAKQKKEVEHQKEIVEERNKEIMDSITYAKRIQSAILPPAKLVKEYLNESFILYQPKDVVAGDFYWMEQKDGKVLFAAADCTGHGVPGAMVSVICNNGLNRSVREYGITDPAKILDKTREIVIQEFEKSEEDVKDGMDIALCSLEGSILQYAGANNSLIVIRKGTTDTELIEEIKADKQPIGKYSDSKPFNTHTIQLQPGDSFYIFSDGYPDQFGGAKGKKFKYRPFRELLLRIYAKPMDEQHTILLQTFEDWKGDLEQIDDVCIIGVRV